VEMRKIEAFGSIREVIDLPNLTNIQIKSYEKFLQREKTVAERNDVGLQAAF